MAQKPHFQPHQPIPSKILLKAFENLESIVGRAATVELVHDLQDCGIALANPDASYSLHQIERGLVRMFEEDGTALLMEFLVKSIKKSYAAGQSTV